MSLESWEANNARFFRSLVFDLFLAIAVVNLVIAFRICREAALSRIQCPSNFASRSQLAISRPTREKTFLKETNRHLPLSASFDGLHVWGSGERHAKRLLTPHLASLGIIAVIISTPWSILVIVLSSSLCRRQTCMVACARVCWVAITVGRPSLWSPSTAHDTINIA